MGESLKNVALLFSSIYTKACRQADTGSGGVVTPHIIQASSEVISVHSSTSLCPDSTWFTEGKSQGSQPESPQAFLLCHLDLGLGRAAGLHSAGGG